MSLHKDTYNQQAHLAEYCRTEQLPDSLKVRKDRVHHYRRLVYNVVNDNLESAFPLTVNLLKEDDWDRMVQTFFSEHKAQSPQVWRLAEEFYRFWKNASDPLIHSHPFLPSLLYFEWMEIEVFMMEDIPYPAFKSEGDLQNDMLVFNPEHRIVHLDYPVHLRPAKSITRADKGDFYLMLYREKESGKVQFSDLSMLLVIILENLIKGLTLNQILSELKSGNQVEIRESTVGHMLDLLEQFNKKGLLLGFK